MLPTFVILFCLSSIIFQASSQLVEYSCNFDNSVCESEIDFPEGFRLDEFKYVSAESIPGARITDVTSITQPTANAAVGPFNEPACKIPWYDNSVEQYFCKEADLGYQCRISTGQLNFCDRGVFLYGRAGYDDEPYKGELSINNIMLKTIGTYEISYYVLMYCDDGTGTDCREGNDFIQITIEGAASQVFVSDHSYGNIGIQRAWQQKSMTFRTEMPDASIKMTVRFERVKTTSQLVFYGFDDLTISFIPPTTISTTIRPTDLTRSTLMSMFSSPLTIFDTGSSESSATDKSSSSTNILVPTSTTDSPNFSIRLETNNFYCYFLILFPLYTFLKMYIN